MNAAIVRLAIDLHGLGVYVVFSCCTVICYFLFWWAQDKTNAQYGEHAQHSEQQFALYKILKILLKNSKCQHKSFGSCLQREISHIL